jgi:lysophospholipase L1-like esterase
MRYFVILLLFSFACEGQPRGNFIYPTIDNLNGLITHWDLDDQAQITTSGGLLVQLNDKGSGGNNVIPASSGVRPSYFSSGGPNNKGYVEVLSGKTFQNLTLSLTQTPFSLYAVVKLPSVITTASNVLSLGTNIKIDYVTSQGGVLRVSGGPPVFFSLNNILPNRTEWQLVRLVYKDDNSYWIDFNQEVRGPYQDAAFGAVNTTVTKLSFDYPGIKVACARLYNRVLSDRQDSVVRASMIQQYSLTTTGKIVVLLGDSHTAGVMSGSPQTLGPYAYRLNANHTGTVVLDGTSGTCVNKGNTVTGGASNLSDKYPTYAKPKYIANTYVVFNYGTNDASIRSGGSPTSAQFRTFYSTYIQAFLDAGYPANHLIMVTPPYSTGGAAAPKLQEVVDDIKAVQSAKGVVLCDWWQGCIDAGYDANTSTDHIHCNDTGHTIVLNLLEGILFP